MGTGHTSPMATHLPTTAFSIDPATAAGPACSGHWSMWALVGTCYPSCPAPKPLVTTWRWTVHCGAQGLWGRGCIEGFETGSRLLASVPLVTWARPSPSLLTCWPCSSRPGRCPHLPGVLTFLTSSSSGPHSPEVWPGLRLSPSTCWAPGSLGVRITFALIKIMAQKQSVCVCPQGTWNHQSN